MGSKRVGHNWMTEQQQQYLLSIYLFWPHHVACKILVPQPQIRPSEIWQWKLRVLTTRPPGKSLQYLLKVDIIKSRRRQWYPTSVLLPGKSMDGGAWWAAVHGVTKNQTWLRTFTSPTPIFLPGEFRGQRNLAGYSPWGHKESDTAEQLSLHFISNLWVSEI